MRRPLRTLSAWLAATIVFSLAIFLIWGRVPHIPPRPDRVPQSAVWAGGFDFGDFIDCTPSQAGEPNLCTVYYDTTGYIYMGGRFTLEGQKQGALATALAPLRRRKQKRRQVQEHETELTSISKPIPPLRGGDVCSCSIPAEAAFALPVDCLADGDGIVPRLSADAVVPQCSVIADLKSSVSVMRSS